MENSNAVIALAASVLRTLASLAAWIGMISGWDGLVYVTMTHERGSDLIFLSSKRCSCLKSAASAPGPET